MPQIAELREIDGAIWARIPPFSPDQGCMQMLSEAAISERDRKTSALLAEIERLREALKEIAEDPGGYPAEDAFDDLQKIAKAALSNEQ